MRRAAQELRLDIDQTEFQHQLVDILSRGGVSFQQAVRSAVIKGMSRQLEMSIERVEQKLKRYLPVSDSKR